MSFPRFWERGAGPGLGPGLAISYHQGDDGRVGAIDPEGVHVGHGARFRRFVQLQAPSLPPLLDAPPVSARAAFEHHQDPESETDIGR